MTLRSTLVTFVALFLLAACDSGPKPTTSSTATPTTTSSATKSEPATTTTAPSASASASGNAGFGGPVPPGIVGADLSLGSSNVDGLEMRSISCKTSGGLFATAGILPALAEQKLAFFQCSTAGETVRTHFAFANEKTTDVRVADASTPEVARCVAEVLRKAKFSGEGKCVVALVLGPR